jgi:hypothetical protein
MRRTLLLTTAALVLAPAAGHAATARFTATLQAERTVAWDQPYGVGLKDCKGDHYVEQRGDETWQAKTRKPFKVVVKKLPGVTFWQFGDGVAARDPRLLGVEAAGMVTRNWTYRSGTTGGWCGGGSVDPPGERDCGTRLPTYLITLTGLGSSLEWSANPAPFTDHEKLSFYHCQLLGPSGVPVESVPRLPGKVPMAAVFNPKRKTIVVRVTKDYGPQSTPVANLGVDRTASAHMTWTLTLNRRK